MLAEKLLVVLGNLEYMREVRFLKKCTKFWWTKSDYELEKRMSQMRKKIVPLFLNIILEKSG